MKNLGLLGTCSIMGLLFNEIQEAEFLNEIKLKNPDFVPKVIPNISSIPKGHKLFVIEGIEIYALNFKNAQKKYNKLK